MDYVKEAKALMKGDGENGSIAIPCWALTATGGDYTLAVFIKQVWFWSQKATDPDGFYRSYGTWEREDYLTRSQVNRGRDWMRKEMGEEVLITVSKKPRAKDGSVRGSAPMLHWKLDVQQFCMWMCKKLTGRCAGNPQVDVQESDRSMCRKAASPPVGKSQVDVQESSRTIYMNQDRESNRDSRQEESDRESNRERDSVDDPQPAPDENSPEKILSLKDYLAFKKKFFEITGKNPDLKLHQDEVDPLAVELWSAGYRVSDLEKVAEYCSWMTNPPHPKQIVQYIEAARNADTGYRPQDWMNHKEWIRGRGDVWLEIGLLNAEQYSWLDMAQHYRYLEWCEENNFVDGGDDDDWVDVEAQAGD